MGKASKHQRDCPAVGHSISSRDCGEGRHLIIPCPASCSYNPLSVENYSQYSEIEGSVIDKSTAFFIRENRGNQPLMSAYERAVHNGITDASVFCLWNFFWVRDAAGKTMADRWADKRFDGLTNDERAIFSAQRDSRPALIEIRNIVNETTIEIVDLFSGQRLTLVDRAFASKGVRFATLFTWLVPSPHFTRILGCAVSLPDAGSLTPIEVFRAIERQLGVPEDADAEQRWLAENWMKVSLAIQESGKAIHITSMASADTTKYTVEYTICGAASALDSRLEQHPGVESSPLSSDEEDQGFTHSYVQLEASGEAPAGFTNELVGSIFVSETTVRLDSIGAEKSANLRATFEKLAGDTVAFRTESTTDTLPDRAKGTFDTALVPKLLLENAPKIKFSTSLLPSSDAGGPQSAAEALRKHHAAWPDSPLPGLNGKTPREAASDPQLRSALIRFVKRMAITGDGKSYAQSAQATETIELLGLHEIAEPTPPNRPALYPADEDDEPEPKETFSGPPINQLSDSEVMRRLDKIQRIFKSEGVVELSAHFVNSASDLLDCLDEMLADELNEFEFECLSPALAIAYHILAPQGTRREDVDPDRLCDLMDYWEAGCDEAFAEGFTKEALAELVADSRQPFVAFQAVTALYKAEEANQGRKFRPESLFAMLAFVLAAVDEIDCAVSA